MSKETLDDNLDIYDDLNANASLDLEARLLSSDRLTSSSLPSLSFAASATFSREGNDLVLTLEGETVVVKNYFATPNPPVLTTMDGAILTPELVASFLQHGFDQDFYASSLLKNLLGGNKPLDNDAIAVVENLKGEVLAIRKGEAVTLQDGDQLFQGDQISTAPDSSASMIFADGTRFKIGGEARISLDQFSFESSTSQGLQVLSILSGAFSYVSGLVAKDDPANVQLRTPVGEIGIRGTKIVGEVDAENAAASITLLEGRILYKTPQGEEHEISQGFETLNIKNGGESVKESTISAERAARSYDVFEDAGEVSNFLQQQPATQQEGAGAAQNNAGEGVADTPLPDISYSQVQAALKAQAELKAQTAASVETALESIGISSDSEGYSDTLKAVVQAELYRQQENGNSEDAGNTPNVVGIEDYNADDAGNADAPSPNGQTEFVSDPKAVTVPIKLSEVANSVVIARSEYKLTELGDIFSLTHGGNAQVTFTRGFLESDEKDGGGTFYDLVGGTAENIFYTYSDKNIVTGVAPENPDSERGISGAGGEGKDLSVEVIFDDVTGDGVRDTFRLIFTDYFPSSSDNLVTGQGRDTEIYSIQLPGEDPQRFSDFDVQGTTAF